jgi:hypothetical protein
VCVCGVRHSVLSGGVLGMLAAITGVSSSRISVALPPASTRSANTSFTITATLSRSTSPTDVSSLDGGNAFIAAWSDGTSSLGEQLQAIGLSPDPTDEPTLTLVAATATGRRSLAQGATRVRGALTGAAKMKVLMMATVAVGGVVLFAGILLGRKATRHSSPSPRQLRIIPMSD